MLSSWQIVLVDRAEYASQIWSQKIFSEISKPLLFIVELVQKKNTEQESEMLSPLTFYSVVALGSKVPCMYFTYYNVWVLLPHGNLNYSVFIDVIYKHKVIKKSKCQAKSHLNFSLLEQYWYLFTF